GPAAPVPRYPGSEPPAAVSAGWAVLAGGGEGKSWRWGAPGPAGRVMVTGQVGAAGGSALGRPAGRVWVVGSGWWRPRGPGPGPGRGRWGQSRPSSRAGAEMLAIAAPDDSRLSRIASQTVAADSRYGARYPPNGRQPN